MSEMLPVGERIKNLREKSGLSLQEFADRTGFSSALVNQIENHMLSPPLGALMKIAHVLGVTIGDIWGEGAGEPWVLTRKGEGRAVSRFASKEGVSYGYGYESLGSGMRGRHFEPFVVTLEPPTVKKPQPSSHDGEEFIFVLEGEVEVSLDGHTDVITAGDSIIYDARIPHRLSCAGGECARILAVVWSSEKK